MVPGTVFCLTAAFIVAYGARHLFLLCIASGNICSKYQSASPKLSNIPNNNPDP